MLIGIARDLDCFQTFQRSGYFFVVVVYNGEQSIQRLKIAERTKNKQARGKVQEYCRTMGKECKNPMIRSAMEHFFLDMPWPLHL